MAKRLYFTSVKGQRRWHHLGHGGIRRILIGDKWKGMGKSNTRKLSHRRMIVSFC